MAYAYPLVVAVLVGTAAVAEPHFPKGQAATGRTPVYLTLMGEPFRGRPGSPAPIDDWIVRADRDRNGSISLAEFVEDSRRFFASLDVDGDGRIDADEIERYEEVVAPPSVRFAGGLRPPNFRETRDAPSGEGIPDLDSSSGGGGRGPGRFAMMGLPQPVAMADADLNRIVTRDEFDRAARKRFHEADKNGDGLLTRDELVPAEGRRRR